MPGAGGQLVGTVDYSDYRRRQNGGASAVIRASISKPSAALKPDLIARLGKRQQHDQVDKLRALGLTVSSRNPTAWKTWPASSNAWGQLAGTEAVAKPAAERFRQRLERLRKANADKPPVRVFYQI